MRHTLVLYETKAWPELERWIKENTPVKEPKMGSHKFMLPGEKLVIIPTRVLVEVAQSRVAHKLLLFGRFSENDLLEILAKVKFK